ncbi:helix-turn-helix transcriptional regulator [Skermanella rosea]|uniref:helix-turn-helix domain-containing protein n=1 Tax=Skermanella rosea TaxID=1817965 RepID=UPI001933A22D|nr:helix-turn-helix transcriptional regulator [Skermanella rosea]UEM01876.1 helix-turn-helix transcriptional regulator [Skermanella rosea]
MTDTITIPRAEYDALRTRLEDLEDVLAAQTARTGITLPAEFANRIMDGENPIRVWREYRGLGLRELAIRSGLAAGFLSEIENGKRVGSIATYRALARSLDTSLDWLADE